MGGGRYPSFFNKNKVKVAEKISYTMAPKKTGAKIGIIIIAIISTLSAMTYLKIQEITGIIKNLSTSFAENHNKNPKKKSITPEADEKKREFGTLSIWNIESIVKKSIANAISNQPLNFSHFIKNLSSLGILHHLFNSFSFLFTTSFSISLNSFNYSLLPRIRRFPFYY